MNHKSEFDEVGNGTELETELWNSDDYHPDLYDHVYMKLNALRSFFSMFEETWLQEIRPGLV